MNCLKFTLVPNLVLTWQALQLSDHTDIKDKWKRNTDSSRFIIRRHVMEWSGKVSNVGVLGIVQIVTICHHVFLSSLCDPPGSRLSVDGIECGPISPNDLQWLDLVIAFDDISPSNYYQGPFLAATKQLYKWYFPSVCLSVRPSVRLSVCHTFLTMFPSSYHHEIFRSYHHGQKWCPCKRSRSEVKGQGHRGQHPT